MVLWVVDAKRRGVEDGSVPRPASGATDRPHRVPDEEARVSWHTLAYSLGALTAPARRAAACICHGPCSRSFYVRWLEYDAVIHTQGSEGCAHQVSPRHGPITVYGASRVRPAREPPSATGAGTPSGKSSTRRRAAAQHPQPRRALHVGTRTGPEPGHAAGVVGGPSSPDTAAPAPDNHGRPHFFPAEAEIRSGPWSSSAVG